MLFRKFLVCSALVAGLLSFSGCMGELPEASTAQDREAYLKLQARYQPIVGVYEGFLTESPAGEADIPVRMEIFIATESNGRNANGEEKLVPVLRAFYRRLDSTDPNTRYFIRSIGYDDTGKITMTVPEKQGLPGVGALDIEGRLQDNLLIARLADYRGPQGLLKLEKLASSPSDQ